MSENLYFLEIVNDLEILELLHQMNGQEEKLNRIIAPFTVLKDHYLKGSEYEEIDAKHNYKLSEEEIRNGVSSFDITHLLVNADIEDDSLTDEERRQILDKNFNSDKKESVSVKEETRCMEKAVLTNDTNTFQMIGELDWEEEAYEDVNRYEHQEIENLIGGGFSAEYPNQKLCIGIGQYKTKGGERLYMTILLDLYDRRVAAFSFGKFFEPEITEKAMDLFTDTCSRNKFAAFARDGQCEEKGYPIVHSSQNMIYKTWKYREICNYYKICQSMTSPGTRGGIAPISTFFSQLKRKLNGYVFKDIQDGIDWLENYILLYNLQKVYHK